MRFLLLIILFVITLTPPTFAQIGEESGLISVYATVCEKITNGESRSSARMRASDKASFKAVENIVELKTYKDNMDGHKFNLKVYNLVDNHLEDIKIVVASQTEEDVCVEVSAFMNPTSIKEVFANEDPQLEPLISDNENLKEDEMFLSVEDEHTDENVNISIPPKPQIVIHEDIRYIPEEQSSSEVAQSEVSDKGVHTENNNEEVNSSELTKVYIDKTSFYNNTETDGFYPYIEHELNKKTYIKSLNELNNPDYIVKSKVLKARVDSINSQTSRLQIVVAVDLIDTQTTKTITEHQNRFVLYNSSEDEQKTASELTKKLIIAAVKKVVPQIKDKRVNVKKTAVITPH